MSASWHQDVLELSQSVEPDIPRIRAVLDQLGILNVDYEDPADYVRSAFVNAAGRGKALAFQAALVKAGLIRRGAQRGPVDIERQLFDRLAELQAFSSRVFTPVDARVAARRMLLASDLVCRIDMDNTHGSGILVAPTLIATAGHVVQDLIDIDEQGNAVAKADSSRQITVTFGDMADLLDNQQRPIRLLGTVAPLAADWLAHYSPPTSHEISGAGFRLESIEGIHPKLGPWDLAILRLAEAKTFRPLSQCRRLPTSPFQVHVLHHPDDGRGKSLPMLWSTGRVDRPLGKPPLRLLHSANTAGGSSGAPMFDSQFRVVGLHQGGMPAGQGNDEKALNRAVPVIPWAPMLVELEHPDTPPLVTTVETVNEDGITVTRHVIGRYETQERIWRSGSPTSTPAERLIAVLGEPGLGLRFTKYLVHSLVTKLGGAYASIDVANCQSDDAMTFAGKIAGAFAAKTRVSATSGLTTQQREVRNKTAPALSQTLNATAKHVGIWLVLEGFDRAGSRPSAAVVDLVRQLIQDLPRMPQVRLVLVGWQESLPVGFETSVEYLDEPSADDIARTLLPPKAPLKVVASLRPLVEQKLVEARQLLRGACPYELAEHARAAVASSDAGPLLLALLNASAPEGT
jgi:hypothetical protein